MHDNMYAYKLLGDYISSCIYLYATSSYVTNCYTYFSKLKEQQYSDEVKDAAGCTKQASESSYSYEIRSINHWLKVLFGIIIAA